MNTPTNDPHIPDVASSVASRSSTHWRLLDGWKRFTEYMDYSTYDYTFDRLRALEMRIEHLERKLVAAAVSSSTFTTDAMSTETKRDQG